VRDLLETLTLNKNKFEVNPKLEKLVKKQDEDLKAKLEKLEQSVESEILRVSVSFDELELVSGTSPMDRLYNVFVRIRALFDKVRSSLKQKFSVKPTSKKENEDDKDATKSQNAENPNEREEKDKKDKNKKDNSDEMLTKKWEELKNKLDKIKVQFQNLNAAYTKVLENEKINKKNVD